MFTIGDCQSILLKLTNERCLELRQELNAATKRQIEAEDRMRVEGDDNFGDELQMMTEAEMEYLTAMEEVKTISKALVCAEQSFSLVKDRIQKLVSRYEHLLMKIDASESFAGASSIVTCESSAYSDGDSEFWESRERAVWARRAKRAEVKAELAAREALLAKQEAQMIRDEKQRELDALKQKLQDLQSESSFSGSTVEKEHSMILAKSINMRRHDDDNPSTNISRQPPVGSANTSTKSAAGPTPSATGTGIGKDRIDDVKKRFRDRMAARKKQQHQAQTSMSPQKGYYAQAEDRPHYQMVSPPAPRRVTTVTPSPAYSSPAHPSPRDLIRAAGEEMYQQLDFYERSLKAVENSQK